MNMNSIKKLARKTNNTLFDAAPTMPLLLAFGGISILLIIGVIALIVFAVKLIIKAAKKNKNK